MDKLWRHRYPSPFSVHPFVFFRARTALSLLVDFTLSMFRNTNKRRIIHNLSPIYILYFLQPGSIPLHRLLAFPTKQNKNKRKKEKEKRKKKGKTKGKRKKWRNKIKTHQERAMPSRSFFVDSGGSIVHSRGVALLRGRWSRHKNTESWQKTIKQAKIRSRGRQKRDQFRSSNRAVSST